MPTARYLLLPETAMENAPSIELFKPKLFFLDTVGNSFVSVDFMAGLKIKDFYTFIKFACCKNVFLIL